MNNFPLLISSIESVHNELQAAASQAVNKSLTIRNWLIGYYIVEFEQKGNDRAEYGAKLLSRISSKIAIKGLSAPELSRCRQFYILYPQILGSLSQRFINLIPKYILGTLSQEYTLIQKSQNSLQVPAEKLI